MSQPTMDVEIALTVTAHTPLCVGAGGSSGSLADKSIIRDGWGRPIIPGSQVKGKARHMAEAIARAVDLDVYHLFGEDKLPSLFEDTKGDKSGKKADLVRLIFGSVHQRSPFHFADLVGVVGDPAVVDVNDLPPSDLQKNVSRIRPSVTINRRRGIAEDSRLLFQETTVEAMAFHQKQAIFGVLCTDDQCTGAFPTEHHLGLVALLWAALRLTTRWGGATSRGLGWARVDVVVRCNGQLCEDDELKQALCDLVNDPALKGVHA